MESLLAVQKRTALATAVSERTIRNVLKRKGDPNVSDSFQENANEHQVKKPLSNHRYVLKNIDESTKFEIHNTIYDMVARKEFVTLDGLLSELKRIQIIEIGRTTLWKLLRELGFKYKKYSNRPVLCEKKHVVHLRTNFLRNYLKIKKEGLYKNIVVLDETWIYEAESQTHRVWTDNSVKSFKDSGKTSCGKRYMILHARTQNGFVDGVGRMFSSTVKSDDYHDSMVHDYFEKWFQELLCILHEPSVIILKRKHLFYR